MSYWNTTECSNSYVWVLEEHTLTCSLVQHLTLANLKVLRLQFNSEVLTYFVRTTAGTLTYLKHLLVEYIAYIDINSFNMLWNTNNIILQDIFLNFWGIYRENIL